MYNKMKKLRTKKQNTLYATTYPYKCNLYINHILRIIRMYGYTAIRLYGVIRSHLLIHKGVDIYENFYGKLSVQKRAGYKNF